MDSKRHGKKIRLHPEQQRILDEMRRAQALFAGVGSAPGATPITAAAIPPLRDTARLFYVPDECRTEETK